MLAYLALGSLAALAPEARAANLFAVVDASGNLVSGGSVSSVSYLGIGQYEVTFTTDVSQCAYIATTTNAYSQALGVFPAGGHLGPQGVYVETKNQGGGLTNGPFQLVVVCGGPGTAFAVVDDAATLVRSSNRVVLKRLGGGRYTLRFPFNVSQCAFVASVADPADGLVFDPSGVYTGSRFSRRQVYVETKNPGGGLQDGIPFHVAVVCPTAPSTRVTVVAADGLTRRGSPGTSSSRSATSLYTVTTDVSVSACAAVGTRGSVDRAVPFTPATVETTAGPAPNSVGIQVRQLLFFGGGLLDEAFHVAIVCS